MKTSVIEVRDMLSVWSVVGVEERIGKVPGVESVTVNFAAASATVRYDETRLDVGDIKSAVRQSGYQSEHKPVPRQASGQQPAGNPAVESTPEAAPASSSAPPAAVPEASTLTPTTVPAPAAPTAAIAAPATSAAAKNKAELGPGLQPSAPVVALTKAASSAPAPTAPVPAPVAPAADEEPGALGKVTAWVRDTFAKKYSGQDAPGAQSATPEAAPAAPAAAPAASDHKGNGGAPPGA